MTKKLKLLSLFPVLLLNINQSTFADEATAMLFNNDDRMYVNTTEEITVAKPYNMEVYEQAITRFYQANPKTNSSYLLSALNYFINQPYFLEPLGEGVDGKYSQEPLFRSDQFDCVSYVDTVLALINSNNLEQFITNLVHIRYNGNINYINRTDWFIDLEWIHNAERLGWIKDVTQQVVDLEQKPIAILAETIIDKPNWYHVKPLKVMHLFEPLPSPAKAQNLIDDLHSKGDLFHAQSSQLAYLPLTRLFDSNGNPDMFYFNQISSGSVIVIVRPNWQIRDNFPGFPHGYGTNLNVSHLGIVIRTEKKLMFYNASSLHQKVESEPLTAYLQKYINSPTIKGIHVEQIINECEP